MNTGESRLRRVRLFLLPLGALVLGVLLFATWVGALAAEKDFVAGANKVAQYKFGEFLPEPNRPVGNSSVTTNANNIQPVNYDFRVSKAAFPNVLNPGSSSNIYQIALLQTGYTSGAATTIYIEDQLPEGITWTPRDIGPWDCDGLSTSVFVSCFYSNTFTTQFQPLRISINVAEDVASVITNTVTVRTDPPDRDTTNNSFTLTSVTTNASVDLSIAKTVSSVDVDAGSEFEYTLVYSNTSNITATTYTISDTLPAGLAIISSDPQRDIETVNGDGTTTIIWESLDDIANTDGEKSISLRVRVLNDPPDTSFTNRVRIISTDPDLPDRNLANNYSEITVRLGRMEITKSASVTSAKVGELFTYTITLRNSTPINFTSVVITDVLDTVLDFVGGSPGLLYSASNRVITYNRGTFPANTAPTTIHIVVRPSALNFNPSIAENMASVGWNRPSSTGSSTARSYLESEKVYVNIIGPAGNFQISTTGSLDEADAGEAISYTISVTNTGNIEFTDVLIANNLPEEILTTGSSIVTPSNVGTISCPTKTRQCSLRLRSLDAGDSVTFRVGAQVKNTITERKTVISQGVAIGTYQLPNGESVELRKTASDRTIVIPSPVYSLEANKVVSPRQAQVNENLTFRITLENTDNKTIPNVRVFDEFPDQLDVTNVTSNRGTATLNTAARTIEVNVGEMPVDSRTVIDIVTRVNTTVTRVDTLENEAEVTYGSTGELNPSVRFRVLPSGTLPVTGWPPSRLGPPAAPLAASPAAPGIAPLLSAGGLLLAAGLAGVLFGLLLLAAGLLARARKPLRAGGYARAGLLLMTLGLMAIIAGVVLMPAQTTAQGPAQLGMLRGGSLPVSTRLPATPTNPHLLPDASGEDPGVEPGQPPAELLPTNTPADLSMFLPTPTPLTLPDYAIPTPAVIPTMGPNGFPPDSSAVTRLVIPDMSLDAIVKFVPYNGDTWLIGGLKQEIAWMGNTSWPGLGSNTGLAGHVDLADGSSGPFWNLNNLTAGDEVKLYTEKYLYTYKVRSQAIVDDHDLSVVDPTTDPQLTLITCTGWDPDLRIYLQRLIVYANLEGVQPLSQGSQ